MCILSLSLSFILIGCSGGSGSKDEIASGVFEDSSVSSLLQLDNFASTKNPLQSIGISYAYAAPKEMEFKCYKGSKVGFNAIALNNVEIQFEVMCDNNVDRGIRKSLLKSMHSKKIIQEYRGGGVVLNENISLTFNSEDSFWGTYDNISAGSGSGCKDKLTFDEVEGTVTIENDAENYAGAGSNQDCLDAEGDSGPGTCGPNNNEVCTADHYKKVLAFQFKNGKLELDPEGIDFEVNNDFVRWCLDNDNNQQCD
jgi:hypothetical protein